LKKNAFLEPSNPSAVFPQNKKPHIIDFRDSKMAGAGFASIGNFRKKMSDRSIPNKYPTTSKTAEEVEAEKMQAEIAAQMAAKKKAEENEYTVEDITDGMDKQLRVSRKGDFKPLTKAEVQANKLKKTKIT
jgi:hypothetical protein